MFPFQQSWEISFQATMNEVNEAAAAPAAATTSRGRGRGRKSWVDNSGGVSYDVGIDLQDDDEMKKKKKMVHRDVERQRRQEMSALFSNIRSLLPLQYVKGKRSTSEHIAESINYIKDLQKNIKSLGEKRDNLKMLQNANYGATSSSNNGGCTIDIYSSAVGLHIQIIACQSQRGFALSPALKVLLEQELHVVSCASNAINGGFHHNIQCQVNAATRNNIDIEGLRQRLYDAVR